MVRDTRAQGQRHRLWKAVWTLVFVAWPAAAQSVEAIFWPSAGHFPAYPAQPREEVVQLNANVELAHDNNLFRLSEEERPETFLRESKKSDTIRRLGAGINVDLPISRQRVLLDAKIKDHYFGRFTFLDHTEYAARAVWKWHAGTLWDGELGYGEKRYLSGFAELQDRIRDLITQDNAFLVAGYRFHPRWRTRAEAHWFDTEHSAGERAALENRATTAVFGLDYITPAQNTLGVQFKYTDTTFHNRELVLTNRIDNEHYEAETSAVANWRFTGKSRINARVGYTNRRHNQVSERNFSGVTGRLSYDWTPTGKTLLNLTAYREIRAHEDETASFQLIEGVSFGPRWAPTSKIIVQAKLLYEEREFRGDPGFVLRAEPTRKDILRAAQIAAGYQPLRNTEIVLAYEAGERNSTADLSEYEYNALSAHINLRF